jgi:hypothetical protein
VRTILTLIAVTVGLWTPVATAQDGGKFTLNPIMSKGPATAPVTIVEFSDYQ